ncbi:hypothetical protein Patl1_18025 [Pistacia atlantica]|uniref:Uncharacterized protein n=1 Tax=Pistacia atlantica TaxID=434234 RepID=A0ACC1BYJ4_9ROSI|nr:hypothetical protein Patl1_18025 [Pistacia atlantica]
MEGRNEYKKGLWTVEEDKILTDYIRVHGKGKWNRVAKVTAGCICITVSCWQYIGWSLIAGRVPGRTDNQVKNHWNTHLSKKLGVKKEKSRVCASSPTLSKESEESSTVPSESNSRPPPNCNGGAVGIEVNESGSLSTMDFYNPQEQQLWSSDEFDHNSFWLSIIDDLNLQVPNLMELTLDFV